MEHLFVFRKLAPRCAVALFDCLRDVDKNFEEMHEDFMETRDGGGKEWRQNVDSLSDSEYLLDGPDSAQCSLRKLQPQDKDVVKAICLESFPVQYPDYWFEEVLARNAGLIVVGGVSGELFCYGITYEGKLVAVIVAELKILSQCCNEVCIFFFLNLYKSTRSDKLIIEEPLRKTPKSDRCISTPLDYW
ncbi:unnamed protein product [Gongylonema pulchrum]|uniref:CNH domain-containing protein n=1 Tax=Gongylonema pulchrum TaxID=637853 RepID=A0A183EC18_9BILA|nr:unnamed protein product [Gongylonema pulchrum]